MSAPAGPPQKVAEFRASELPDFPVLEPNSKRSPSAPELRTPAARFSSLRRFFFIRQNVVDLLRALQFGPVVVAHYVSEPFKFYSSGVFNGDGCDSAELGAVNHASVIVGYDLEAPVPFLRFQNSWGSDWGEAGFYRIAIGELSRQNSGLCLVAGTPFMVFPDVA